MTPSYTTRIRPQGTPSSRREASRYSPNLDFAAPAGQPWRTKYLAVATARARVPRWPELPHISKQRAIPPDNEPLFRDHAVYPWATARISRYGLYLRTTGHCLQITPHIPEHEPYLQTTACISGQRAIPLEPWPISPDNDPYPRTIARTPGQRAIFSGYGSYPQTMSRIRRLWQGPGGLFFRCDASARRRPRSTDSPGRSRPRRPPPVSLPARGPGLPRTGRSSRRSGRARRRSLPACRRSGLAGGARDRGGPRRRPARSAGRRGGGRRSRGCPEGAAPRRPGCSFPIAARGGCSGSQPLHRAGSRPTR